MFVRFDCGCKGIALPDGRDLCIYACDTDDGGLGFHYRDLSDKSRSPLPADQVDQLVSGIATLMRDGHSFRIVQGILHR